jgi:hypothetical protein
MVESSDGEALFNIVINICAFTLIVTAFPVTESLAKTVSPAVVSVLELNLEPKTSVFVFFRQVIVFYFVTDIIFGLVVSLI